MTSSSDLPSTPSGPSRLAERPAPVTGPRVHPQEPFVGTTSEPVRVTGGADQAPTAPWSLSSIGAQARRAAARPRRVPLQGRRVKRIVRRIELWSVLKVSLLFYSCVYVVTLLSGVLLWGFAYSANLIGDFESFMADVGFDDFRFYGDEIFRRAAIIGAVLVLAGVVLTVLATALVNVISELTGGIRFVVIEVVEPDSRSASTTSELAPPRWREDADPASGRW